MGEPALQLVQFPEKKSGKFPFLSLLTKALVEALCSELKSEITFGNLERVTEPRSVPFWIEALVRGDLEGKIGLGCEEATLAAISRYQSEDRPQRTQNVKQVLLHLHESLVEHFEKQFSEEAFRCDFKKGSGFQVNYELGKDAEELYSCPVETSFGVITLYLALHPTSKELLSEVENKEPIDTSRKIRIYSSQIDGFVEQVNQLEQLEKRLLQGPEVRAQLRSQIKKMKRMLHEVRTESLNSIYVPASRLVTELSKSQGKQVSLEMVGTWLYLHKSFINFIYEPVLHLIRNAVDHGIEEPLKREQNGKKAQGNIRFIASFEPGVLRIVFSDDGGGLDFGLIRDRAVAKGIFSAEEANIKPKEELAQLIFQPGFSTRSHSNSSSGRGLGLDIVKKSLEAVGGTVRLLSTSLHGTSFELMIPVNQDFSLVSQQMVSPLQIREEEEKMQLLDELNDYQERFSRALQALDSERSIQSAYEAYRIAHLMKGICGFLGWQRVVSYLYPFEEVLKLVSEEKIPLNELTLYTLKDGAFQLRGFCSAARSQGSFSLNKVRRSESRLLQLIWSSVKSEEKTHLFLGKYHLNAIEHFFLPLAQNGSFSVRPEADFSRAASLPFGALIQFNGDRRGFAGIYLPESTLREVVHPLVTGTKQKLLGKKALGSLAEFGNLMGSQFAEVCGRIGIQIQPAAPLTYYGLGEPMKVLGSPTYCFQCEINGYPFFIAGDFRLPQELSESIQSTENYPISSMANFSKVVEESLSQCELKAVMGEEATQSDLIGFDGGITSVFTLSSEDKTVPDMVFFLSCEAAVTEHLSAIANERRKLVQADPLDFFDSLSTVTNDLGLNLKRDLENSRIKVILGAPTQFVGKAYVANFNRLFLTNKLVGKTEKGRIEAQVLFTEFSEEKAS